MTFQRPQNYVRIIAVLILLILTVCSQCTAKVIYVDGNAGNDSNTGLSWPVAVKTVRAGIATASPGDEIWVSAGTYYEYGNTLKTGIALYGGFVGYESFKEERNLSDNVTILDGRKTGLVLNIEYQADSTTRVDGFTIQNGSYYDMQSGGIYCDNSSAVICNNTFRSNNSDSGGAIYCSSGSPLICNNAFIGNFGAAGGGIYCSSSSAVIANNTFIGNNNAICCWFSSAIIINNIIAFNSRGIRQNGSIAPTVRNNCVYNPDGVDYYNMTNFTGTNGNISVDPKIQSENYGQIHLQLNSPCVNAGDSSIVQPDWLDINGRQRIHGTNVDMGADESGGSWWTGPSIMRVSPTGSDSNNGLTWNLAKKTIQAAVDANPGGEIWVAAGTYNEHVDLKPYIYLYGGFVGAETSRSQRDWTRHETIIDGQGSGSEITVLAGHKYNTVDGFTLRNGHSGIDCTGSELSIRNNTITGHSSEGANESGAIHSKYGAPTISFNKIKCNSITGIYADFTGEVTNNTITQNMGQGYGGVKISNSAKLVANNIIAYNGSKTTGGIYCGSATGAIINNTIAWNTGVGLYVIYGGPVRIENNIIAYNSQGAAVYLDAIFTNNCVYNPEGQNYYWGSDFTGINDNISIDPKFISANFGQMHLQADSPCTDTGDDAAISSGWTDIDGQPRLQKSHVDMGADEFDGNALAYTPSIIRVSPLGSDSNDGSSWTLARKTIQAAINAAALNGGQVWVAAGTYNECVNLEAGVDIYGGFAGNETSLEQRDALANKAILDAVNSNPVINVYTGNRQCVIDGLTIRNGKEGDRASGINCSYSSPIITNNVIENCGGYLGAVRLLSTNATIANNRFLRNKTYAICGGRFYGNITGNIFMGNTESPIYCNQDWPTRAHKKPEIAYNRFIGNTAWQGGAIYIYSSDRYDFDAPLIHDNLIASNSAEQGGAIYCDYPNPVIVNNTIVNNTATNNSEMLRSVIYFSGCAGLFANNIIAFNSYGLLSHSSTVNMQNNCIYNPGAQSFSGMDDPTGVNGNISADPEFIAPDGGQWHLRPESPCIDKGDDTAIRTGWSDMDGQNRLLGSHVDIGADESDGTSWSYNPSIIRVKKMGNDANNGLSWQSAKRTIQAGIDAASLAGGEVWVAAGTYNEHVELHPYMQLYGGFSGCETAREQRNWNANETIIDGTSSGRVVAVFAGSTRTIVDGFTIRNGKLAASYENDRNYGAGIYVSGIPITISNNKITGNSIIGGGNDGAGIYCIRSNAEITHNLISSNYASSGCGGITCVEGSLTASCNKITNNGGGINAGGASAIITGNEISYNIAVWEGDAIYTSSDYSLIANNIIKGNGDPDTGSPVYLMSDNAIVINNTIVDNFCNPNGGAVCIGNINGTIANNIVAFNSSGIYFWNYDSLITSSNNCIYNPGDQNNWFKPGQGDKQLDPLFINYPIGNYHLQSNSPCINAGANGLTGLPSVDFDGSARISAGLVDIGALEYQITPTALNGAKKMADGSWFSTQGAIVTAAFTDCFYIESDNRATGIRIDKAGHTLSAGMRADVAGKLYTNSTGERSITASWAVENGSGSIAPLFLTDAALGGSSWPAINPPAGTGQKGVIGGRGLNNIGLLVTICGKFGYVNNQEFTITDGSGVTVKCVAPAGVSLDQKWGIVGVTGISSCEPQGTAGLSRVLKIRKQADIVPYLILP